MYGYLHIEQLDKSSLLNRLKMGGGGEGGGRGGGGLQGLEPPFLHYTVNHLVSCTLLSVYRYEQLAVFLS